MRTTPTGTTGPAEPSDLSSFDFSGSTGTTEPSKPLDGMDDTFAPEITEEEDSVRLLAEKLANVSPDAINSLLALLSHPERLTALESASVERPATTPQMLQRELRARDRTQAKNSMLDYAPHGGVFVNTDGNYVNYDGKPCDAEGKVKKGS